MDKNLKNAGKTPWTKAELKTLAAAKKKGTPHKDIAEKLGRSLLSVASRIRRID